VGVEQNPDVSRTSGHLLLSSSVLDVPPGTTLGIFSESINVSFPYLRVVFSLTDSPTLENSLSRGVCLGLTDLFIFFFFCSGPPLCRCLFFFYA